MALPVPRDGDSFPAPLVAGDPPVIEVREYGSALAKAVPFAAGPPVPEADTADAVPINADEHFFLLREVEAPVDAPP